MAAYRNGIGTVLIPQDNVRDLEDIDPTVRAGLRFIPVATVDEVFAAALCQENEPARQEAAPHVEPIRNRRLWRKSKLGGNKFFCPQSGFGHHIVQYIGRDGGGALYQARRLLDDVLGHIEHRHNDVEGVG